MGSKPGELEHPHYVAVSNTNRVIVSDSNNHRIQVRTRTEYTKRREILLHMSLLLVI